MTFDTAAIFAEEFDKALAEVQAGTDLPLEEWSVAGRRPRQDVSWWRENGPQLAQNYIDWYESQPDISVWITPDGRPAIELDLTVKFGSIWVRMMVDQILKAGTALIVVDLKSGSKRPDSLTHLGIYACGVELAYGIRPKYGTHFLHRGVGNRKNDDRVYFQRPEPLTGYQYSIDYYSKQLEMFERGIQSEVFLAHPGERCDRCGVAFACLAAGGPEAAAYDPSHPSFGR